MTVVPGSVRVVRTPLAGMAEPHKAGPVAAEEFENVSAAAGDMDSFPAVEEDMRDRRRRKPTLRSAADYRSVVHIERRPT